MQPKAIIIIRSWEHVTQVVPPLYSNEKESKVHSNVCGKRGYQYVRACGASTFNLPSIIFAIMDGRN